MWNYHIIASVSGGVDSCAGKAGEAGAVYSGETGKERKNI